MSTAKERREIYLKPRWRRLRMAVLRSVGGVCQSCHKRAATEVHHKTPIRDGGEIYDPGNLIPLCHHCHMAEHPQSPLASERRAWRELAKEQNHAEI